MHRRQMLFTPLLALGALAPAMADTPLGVDYTPQVYAKAIASGEPFLLDFYADW